MNGEDTVEILPNGVEVRFGYINPEELRFGAVDSWEQANPVLREDECEDHNDFAAFATPVKYQKNNNCTNASLSSLVECGLRAAGENDVPELSLSYLYAHFNGGRDAGAFCRDLADAARTKGFPSKALWPDEKIYLRGQVPAAVVEDANKRLAIRVYQCLSWQDVVSALARRFLVYHGFVLGRAFINGTGKDGKVPAFDGLLANGHAMYSYGLTRRFGDLRTITRNSWSNTWGDQGNCYIDKSYFWSERGNFVNLDCYAIQSFRRADPLPKVA